MDLSTIRQTLPAAARQAALLAAAPMLRASTTDPRHAKRLAAVRRFLPGGHQQFPRELLGFAELAAPRRPVRICEIGTARGGTSLFLTGLADSVETFVGIDLRPWNDGLVRRLAPRRARVEFLTGSSRDPDIRARLVSLLGGQPLDLLFIDGDHGYEGVRSDLLEYRDLVRPGGLIAFHDIVPGYAGDDPPWAPDVRAPGDVPVFWREVRERFRHWEFVDDWAQGGLGIGVIEHDPAVVGV